MSAPTRLLFVCMGNICRSPTAEGVFRHQVRQAGLEHAFHIDSAGTHGYHVGAPPDERAQAHARRRGIDISGLRARKVRHQDFEAFDLLLVMDEDNLSTLRERCPPEHQAKLRLLTEFGRLRAPAVPDPYYGGAEGFERVLDLVEDACAGLLTHAQGRGEVWGRS